jgi:rare lipoprotein A (peptidoglycan hydrolase)
LTFRRAGALALLVTVATLTITTASTARPPSTLPILAPDDFRPLTLPYAASSSPIPTFDLGQPASPMPIGDFQVEAPAELGPRATPRQANRAASLLKPTPTPKPTPKPTNRRSGTASWYCLAGSSPCHHAYSGGLYAAAGPALRVGNWRGRTVKVCASGRCVNVKLIDWCQCYGSRIIDLYSDAYRRLAPLSSGTVGVTVYW